MFWHTRTYLDRAAGVRANPSSPHKEGREAKRVLEDARQSIARLLEVQADDVVFTGGATEANALAILGLARPGAHMLYLPSAHASVIENMKIASRRGVAVEAVPIRDRAVDREALAALLRRETVLVSMDAVCGETGVIWNTREIAHTISRFSTRLGHGANPQKMPTSRIFLHVDASQAPLTEKLTRSHFGADLITLDASKVGSVRGIGALVAHRTIPLQPLYGGGGQERGLRPGSEAYELVGAFAACLWQAANGRDTFRTAAAGMRSSLIEELSKTIPELYVNEGPTVREQAPHILNFSLPGRDTDYLVALLDEAGFAVSTRSACETDSVEGSRAVLALTGDPERARATLRISFGPETPFRALARFARVLSREVAFVDKDGRR